MAAAIALPLAVGGVSAFLTGGGMEFYEMYEKPALSPPGWVFLVVWTVLYILMGTASFLVWSSDASPARKNRALYVYALQLGVNFFWPLIFFRLEMFLAAFLWLAVLWLLVAVCTLLFYHIRPSAGKLMLPYLFWCIFALYLNFGVYILN